MASDSTLLPETIGLIDDMHLGHPHVIGTYALLGDEVALVDPGPTTVLPALEQGLAAYGVALADVRTILLTHIHLDHAGSTGTLVARYPHMRVYVHERGAPHMIAPERLLSSATRLYGDQMERLWGEFRAVPEGNITTLAGGETIQLAGRALDVFYAPGHASHHVVYLDNTTGAAFVGDVGGVRLPGSAYVRPATPPPDIDLEAWGATLDRLRDADPQRLMLTHFGPADKPAEHIEQYRARLWRWAETVRDGIASGQNEAAQLARLRAHADTELDPASETGRGYDQATPLDQSWAGLVRYWRKREAKS